jgi:hypothetical protein
MKSRCSAFFLSDWLAAFETELRRDDACPQDFMVF